MQELDRRRLAAAPPGGAARRARSNFVRRARRSNWNLESDRFEVWKDLDRRAHEALEVAARRRQLRARLRAPVRARDRDAEAPATVSRGRDGAPAVEIHSVRPAIRRTLAGITSTDLVIEITQRRDGYFDEREQDRTDCEAARPARAEAREGRQAGLLLPGGRDDPDRPGHPRGASRHPHAGHDRRRRRARSRAPLPARRGRRLGQRLRRAGCAQPERP